jgi:recombination associated protein RdgC
MEKAAIFYKISDKVDFLPEQLEAGTETPLAQLERSRYSWAIWEESESPILDVMGYKFMRLRLQERILPSAVLKDFVATEVKTLEEDQDRKLSRMEKKEIKEKLEDKLLPRAFIQTTFTTVIINEKDGLITVCLSSPNKADDVIASLRACCSSLPVKPLRTLYDGVSTTMTTWIAEDESTRPENIGLEEEYWFESATSDNSHFKASGVDYNTESLKLIIGEGHRVDAMKLSLDDVGTFKLTSNLIVSGFKPGEMAFDEVDSEEDIHAGRILEADLLAKIAKSFDDCFNRAKDEIDENEPEEKMLMAG